MKISIGDSYIKTFAVSESMIDKFSKITGDKNPLHLNDAYAKSTIFKKRIAHGFLVGGFISAVLGSYYPGNGTIYLSQNMKFISPVFINDSIKVEIKIINISKKIITLSTNCFKNNNELVIEGEAVVLFPPLEQ